MFSGSLVALVTPMFESGEVDYDRFEQLIDWHLASKSDGLVILGTTAESPTITSEERVKLTQLTIARVNKRCPVVVGTGTNCTQHSIELTRQAHDLGADAALLITPYYNKPTQEGLILHHEAIAHAVAIPQILYNNPSRTAVDMLPETVIKLSRLSNIVALKETVSDVSRFKQIANEADLDLLSGNDADAAALIQAGGTGVISVVANVAPKTFRNYVNALLASDEQTSVTLGQKLAPLASALFIESNPIPTKWALHELGRIKKGIRLPLTWLSEQHEETVRTALINEEKTCVL